MSLSTPPVSWMLPESDIPLAIEPRKSYNKSINCAFYIISGCGCRMDTYAYLAHLTEDGRTQTILEHLKGTASLCSAFAAAFDAEAQGQLAGMAHDIGKYSAAFQRRLHGGPKVDHASARGFRVSESSTAGGCFCDLRTPRRPPRRRQPGRRPLAPAPFGGASIGQARGIWRVIMPGRVNSPCLMQIPPHLREQGWRECFSRGCSFPAW